MLLGKWHFVSSVSSSGWNSHVFSQVLHWLTTVFSAHLFACELCTGRYCKGAFDHCCKISDLSFISYCAVAEFCMCVTPINDKSLSCLATSIHVWVLLLEQCFVTVMDVLSCFKLLVLPQPLIPASDVLSFLCPPVISCAAVERLELALQRLSINVSHWREANLRQRSVNRG